MLSLLQKLRTKLYRAKSTTVPKMDLEARMGHDDSPASVWIPSSALAERHHLDRHRSFRRLSRKLSSGAKQISNSTCNPTACAIAVCFITAILALIVSCFTFYLYVQSHGLGHEMEIIEKAFNPNSDSQHGASPSPRFDGPQTTMPSPSHEEAAKSAAYAHIVGADNGPRGNDRQLECLAQWKANATHNVNFLGTYGIEIVEPGYYYVYTQIYFSDSESGATVDPSSQQALPMRSSTNRNHVPLMESVVPFKEYATKYHGGVFHLDKGDKITVSVSNDNLRINTGSDKTFFGVFMLRSTTPDHAGAAAAS
ncbi:lymphotoxin-alpha [Strongylocentrotus purpuratus]|uniref:THD domain-containing protein n=1 Tax=Strongylocentrotus purpuratus TaxID=7668 RepID=A0A7M7NLZ3_STRPU|nr:lymphotoxin-alpha [Strongylocentrotus purpuratus]|eukprot:XP_011676011.1 PREDICTED: lymphotoxin-alpha [Strongylocentrotus purpuratus]